MPAATPEPPPFRLSRLQWTVRVGGGLLLTAAAAMLVLGLTLGTDRLAGPQFVLYWSWCFLIAATAILLAALDLVLLRRAYKRSRRELFRREFMAGELAEKLRQRADRPP